MKGEQRGGLPDGSSALLLAAGRPRHRSAGSKRKPSKAGDWILFSGWSTQENSCVACCRRFTCVGVRVGTKYRLIPLQFDRPSFFRPARNCKCSSLVQGCPARIMTTLLITPTPAPYTCSRACRLPSAHLSSSSRWCRCCWPLVASRRAVPAPAAAWEAARKPSSPTGRSTHISESSVLDVKREAKRTDVAPSGVSCKILTVLKTVLNQLSLAVILIGRTSKGVCSFPCPWTSTSTLPPRMLACMNAVGHVKQLNVCPINGI